MSHLPSPSSRLNLNLGTDRSLEKLANPGDELVGLHELGLQRLPAGKRQKAVRLAGGAVQRPAHFVDEPPDLFEPPGRDSALKKGEAARDGLNHVVEVVRDAPGQLADDLHLLRLNEPLLGRPQRRVGLAELRRRRKSQGGGDEPPEHDCGEERHQCGRDLDHRRQAVDRDPERQDVDPMGRAAQQDERGEEKEKRPEHQIAPPSGYHAERDRNGKIG